MKRVVIVGAGLSGLSAAWFCQQEARSRGESVDITLLEASDRAGGNIGTESVDGFLVERGADGFLAEKVHAVQLAEALGIGHRLIRPLPAKQGASVVRHGRLVPIPEGFSLLAPTRLRPMLRSPLLSRRGKLRLALDLVLPRGPNVDDESLASFVRRRFGQEVLHTLAQPLAAGIYGADPEKLGLRATLPRFLEAERTSRSVIRGLRQKARRSENAQGARYGLFASFDGGMQVLIDALVTSLSGTSLRTAQAVRQLTLTPTTVRVATDHDQWEAEAVILAVAAPTARALLQTHNAGLADALGAINHGSAATVTFGFEATAFPQPLPGYGFVVPTLENRASIAGTFASRKWAGRAPAGCEVVRIFLGGPTSPRLASASDETLANAAREELTALLGVRATPQLTRVWRYINAMPHYHVGHQRQVSEIEARAARYSTVLLAGNSLHGVGIPDVIATSERTARSLFEAR